MPPCSFVYFDAGFTLLKPDPSVGYHYSAVARKYGVEVSARKLDEVFAPAWKLCRARSTSPVPYGRNLAEAESFWRGVVIESFRQAGVEPPKQNIFYLELFDLFSQPSCWSLYEDVAAAFALLDEAAIPYGILSNWDPRLRLVLDGMGLLDRLSALVISSEVGCEKPAPEVFHAARKASGYTEKGCSFGLIGDEAEADGRGALRAGWRQCLVVRNGAPVPGGGDLAWKPNLVDAVAQLL